MKYFLLITFSIIFFAACQKTEPAKTASADAKRFALRGKVVAVDKAKKRVTVAHEAVKGYMDAMTMEFPVKDDFVLNDLTKDAEVRADLIVDKDSFWLENFVVSAAPNPNQPAPPAANENFAQTGKEVPDFALTNQDGKPISLKDFRGKALAITFIYTRCPLPEYCILMSENFSGLADEIERFPDLKNKIRLLSISFDPKNDTPQELKDYGLRYLSKYGRTDFTVWQLAAAPEAETKTIADFFGLRYEIDAQNKTQINHSLRTVVVAPDGTMRKVFSGNDWTTDELLKELEEAGK